MKSHIFLPDVVLDIAVARDMPATQGMAVAQYMVVGLFMVAVMVMVVMDHAVAQLFLRNMLVIWRSTTVHWPIPTATELLQLDATPFEIFRFFREQLKLSDEKITYL